MPCPSVVTHHGALARPDNLSRFYEGIFTQGARILASKVLCVCNSDYELLRKRGIPERKLQLHHNGIDRPPLTWEQRRATHPHDIMRLAIVGRLSSEKNHKRLFDVLSRLSARFSFPWVTDILGEGSLKSELSSYAHRLGIQHRTRFLGYQNEAWRALDQYDCVLNFSHGEGLPISLLEAGWRTTPVFASAVGGIPELCGPDGAEYFDLKEPDEVISDRLAHFCLHEERRRSSATDLFNRVRGQYSQRHWLNTAEEVYRSAIGVRI
jgi:glycosyltransferase involved in cell wall biosynthesis